MCTLCNRARRGTDVQRYILSPLHYCLFAQIDMDYNLYICVTVFVFRTTKTSLLQPVYWAKTESKLVYGVKRLDYSSR